MNLCLSSRISPQPIPEDAQIVRSTGRVYIIREKNCDPIQQYNKDKRLTIGKLNSSDASTMNPNENYAMRYPLLFNEASKGKVAHVTRRTGMLISSLACASELDLYPTLVDACGPEYANFLFDFAMYSIQYKTNVARDFEPLIADQMLFCEKHWSDSWISDFFSQKLSQSQIERFKELWIQRFKDAGHTNVWLCIDGSNNDTASENCELAERGHAKSNKNVDIYAYIYAVDAQTGMPVTYDLCRGGQVDKKSLLKVIRRFETCGLKVKGIILDRGFCDSLTVEAVLNSGYEYVIMMKENLYGFTHQWELHSSEVRNNADCLVKEGIFANTFEGKMFKSSSEKSYITLVYDAENSGERGKHFMGEVLKEKEKRIKELEKNGFCSTDSKYRKYFDVNEKEGIVTTNCEFQKEINRKGFSALACSENFSAAEVLEKYDLRDVSKKRFMVAKTQLGYHTGRAHCDAGLEGRHLVCFIAGIIRNEIGNKCQACGYELPTALREESTAVNAAQKRREAAEKSSENGENRVVIPPVYVRWAGI